MKQKRSVLTANINYHRSLLGIKQKDLEQALGISTPTYNRRCYTEGFTVAELKILSRVLRTTVSELIKGV